jgi:hypothetical protein
MTTNPPVLEDIPTSSTRAVTRPRILRPWRGVVAEPVATPVGSHELGRSAAAENPTHPTYPL